MYINIDFKTVAMVCGAVTGIAAVGALAWKMFQWLHHQKEQDEELKWVNERIERVKKEISDEIKTLQQHHNEDIAKITQNHESVVKAIQKEQTLLVYGQLACLKGLSEQGCDGPVTDAIDRLEKHINERAHE